MFSDCSCVTFVDIAQAGLEKIPGQILGAEIIVSIANGFLCPEKHRIIPALIIPGTEFVDIYRGIDTAKLIYAEFLQKGFMDVELFPTNTEIFVSAINVK